MPTGTIMVYGVADCEDTQRSRALLDRIQVPYTYVALEQDSEATEQVKGWNGGARKTPTIVFPDGRRLVEPSDTELEEATQVEGTISPG